MAEPVDYSNLPQRPRCAACGYDRSGSLHTPICPECGNFNPPEIVTLADYSSGSSGGNDKERLRWPWLALGLLCTIPLFVSSLNAVHQGWLVQAALLVLTALFITRTLWKRTLAGSHGEALSTLLVSSEGILMGPGWSPRPLRPYQPNWQAELVSKDRRSRITIRRFWKWGRLSVFSEPLIDFSFEHNSPEQARGVLQIIQAGIKRAGG